jgi:putative transposase
VSEYHHSPHAVWDIKYHLVWITKYRYNVLRGEVAERARDLLREICAAREVRIVRGAVSPDHVQMLVVAPRSWRRRSSGSF